MSNFFAKLVARSRGDAPTVAPRLPSRFEPAAIGEGPLGQVPEDMSEGTDEEVTPAAGPRPSRAEARRVADEAPRPSRARSIERAGDGPRRGRVDPVAEGEPPRRVAPPVARAEATPDEALTQETTLRARGTAPVDVDAPRAPATSAERAPAAEASRTTLAATSAARDGAPIVDRDDDVSIDGASIDRPSTDDASIDDAPPRPSASPAATLTLPARPAARRDAVEDPDARSGARDLGPTEISVTIGRLEIRTQPSPARPRAPERAPTQSLDEYLRGRERGRS